MTTEALIAAGFSFLAADHNPWGFVQNVESGILVFAVSEQIAELVLAWELNGQVSP